MPKKATLTERVTELERLVEILLGGAETFTWAANDLNERLVEVEEEVAGDGPEL